MALAILIIHGAVLHYAACLATLPQTRVSDRSTLRENRERCSRDRGAFRGAGSGPRRRVRENFAN